MIRIKILNFNKFNPRKDVKSSSWFRLENSFWQDDKFFELDSDGKMVWIALLSKASQEQKEQIVVEPALMSAILRIEKQKVLDAIEFLKSIEVIEIIKKSTSRRRNVHVTRTSRTRTATDGRTDGRDGRTDESNVLESDASAPSQPERNFEIELDEIYQAYPKRDGDQGKGKGLKSLKKQFESGADPEKCLKAAKNYAEHCRLTEKTGSSFVKQFKTWCGSVKDSPPIWGEWVDWIPPDETSQGSSKQKAAELAEQILSSVKRHGRYSGSAAKVELGEELWGVVKSVGGWGSLCTMPPYQSQKKLEAAILAERGKP